MLEATHTNPQATDRAPSRRTVRASLRLEHLRPGPNPLHPVDVAEAVLVDSRARWDDPPVSTPVTARLRWTSTDPAVVTARFVACDGPAWVLCPDLLRAGLHAPVGVGDVSVLPDPFRPARADLVLSTPDGYICLSFYKAEMAGFLDRIPAERLALLDTDAALAALLADPTVGGEW